MKDILFDTLYSRTIDDKVKMWRIGRMGHNSFDVEYGVLGGKLIQNVVYSDKVRTEAVRRRKIKINKGYRSLTDLNIYVPEYMPNRDKLVFSSIITNMDKVILDENEVFKSMLCQKFKDDKFNYPALAQPKINGLRSTNSKVDIIGNKGTMFEEKETTFRFLSREGKPYILNCLAEAFKRSKNLIDFTTNFDGELYIPEAPLNVIRSAVPYINKHGTVSKSNSNTDKVQYWIFDLAIPDYSQLERIRKLNDLCLKMENTVVILPKDPHEAMALAKHHFERDDKRVFQLTGTIVHSDKEFKKYSQECIEADFEGAVLRDLNAEYAFGQRPKTMVKLKHAKHTECEIINIIGEQILIEGTYNTYKYDPATIKFVLRNDINNETFECTPEADHYTRVNLLTNKQKHIGNLATVRFYERSGVKKVPFHANVEAWDRVQTGDLNPNDLNKE